MMSREGFRQEREEGGGDNVGRERREFLGGKDNPLGTRRELGLGWDDGQGGVRDGGGGLVLLGSV